MSDPSIYLSKSEGRYRIISHSVPVGRDELTASDALSIAKGYKLQLDERAWDGDIGQWVPLTSLVPMATTVRPEEAAIRGEWNLIIFPKTGLQKKTWTFCLTDPNGLIGAGSAEFFKSERGAISQGLRSAKGRQVYYRRPVRVILTKETEGGYEVTEVRVEEPK